MCTLVCIQREESVCKVCMISDSGEKGKSLLRLLYYTRTDLHACARAAQRDVVGLYARAAGSLARGGACSCMILDRRPAANARLRRRKQDRMTTLRTRLSRSTQSTQSVPVYHLPVENVSSHERKSRGGGAVHTECLCPPNLCRRRHTRGSASGLSADPSVDTERRQTLRLRGADPHGR